MATISAYGSKKHYHLFKLTVTENSYDVASNTSTISFSFNLSEKSGYYFNWEQWGSSIKYTITINGTSYTGTIPNYTPSTSGTVLKSASGIKIPHNSDGKKTISISFSVDDNTGATYTCGDASASGSMKLTDIPRGSTLANIANFNLVDDNDNPNKFNVSIDKKISSYYDCLTIKCGETIIKSYDGILDEDEISFSLEELDVLYGLNKSSNDVLLTFLLTTYSTESKDIQIGEDSIVECIGYITNANPIFTDFEYEDINSVSANLSDDIILGYSTLKVNISTKNSAISQKYSDVVSYLIENIQKDYSSTENVCVEIPNYNKNNITVTAYDSRQNYTSIIKEIPVVSYKKLTADERKKTYSRENNVGSQVTIEFGGTWWNDNFGKQNNSLSATYKYSIAGKNTWVDGGEISLTTNENEYLFSGAIKGDADDNGFNLENSYDVVVIVSDKLDSVSFTYQIIAGSPAMKIKGNKVLKINNIPFEEIISKGESILGEILFENETGVGTNITLAKNADNYSYLEIFNKDNDGVSNSTKVYSPNGKKVSLHITNLNNTGNATYIKSAQATINGTTITFVTNGFGFNGEVSFVSPSTVNTPKSNPKIYITRVVGYKLSASPTETQPKETDYVVESGSNSQWTWQKWNSGIAECWGNFTASGTNKVWVSPMYLLNKAYIGPINYPITFIETPIEVANVIYCKNACWLYKESDNANDNQVSTTHSGQYVPVKVNPFNNGTLSVTVSIHVKGKWK